ncbi:MAG: 50S ribosomal protein L29 [candidate division Zixibacteria bacterium]|nr:50S ribosomal protein L29 [candidate division Zixibacteria bacterium]
MKIDTLRDMTRDELLQKKHELMEELFNLNMRRSLKELDNPLRLRTLRRDIAKVETILSEDRQGIRMIVDTPVSILDRKEAAKKNDEEKSE